MKNPILVVSLVLLLCTSIACKQSSKKPEAGLNAEAKSIEDITAQTPTSEAAVLEADEAWAKAIASKSVEQTVELYDADALTAGSAMTPRCGGLFPAFGGWRGQIKPVPISQFGGGNPTGDGKC